MKAPSLTALHPSKKGAHLVAQPTHKHCLLANLVRQTSAAPSLVKQCQDYQDVFNPLTWWPTTHTHSLSRSISMITGSRRCMTSRYDSPAGYLPGGGVDGVSVGGKVWTGVRQGREG